MFIPYSSDAPIYHWPFAVVGLIILNFFLFFHAIFSDSASDLGVYNFDQVSYTQAADDESGSKDFDLGNTSSWQWLLSTFRHAGPVPLIFNMLYLWIFGLIVEGKVGWYKFLGIYLVIAALQAAITQLVISSADAAVYPIGGNAIVLSLMAICMVWAPSNNVQCVFVITWGLRVIYNHYFELSVLIVAGFGIFFQCFAISLLPFPGSSSSFLIIMLYLFVMMFSSALAVLLLKLKLVDCEEWDCFSVWAGKHQMTPGKLDELRRDSKEYQDKEQSLINGGIDQIESILRENQDPSLAYRAHTKMRHRYQNWKLPDVILLQIIKLYCERKEFQAAIPAMVEYVKIPGDKSNQVRLRLANVLLQYEQRPNQAIKVLRKINQQELQEKEMQLFQKLLRHAGELRDQDDLLEATGEDW
ncbi:MAG: hypothetical protein COA78_16030 [Blastopirellula sp.]|nr:MAG: hypothetical protein COA78_16030 [Blastopirellula sp.]